MSPPIPLRYVHENKNAYGAYFSSLFSQTGPALNMHLVTDTLTDKHTDWLWQKNVNLGPMILKYKS